MHFSIQRESLLKPLQLVAGVIERRQTMPILANVLFNIKDQSLTLTGTDLEVEMVARADLTEIHEEGATTIPARKLLDICKSLPSDAQIDIKLDAGKVVVKSGRSRFSLMPLPASDFPKVEEVEGSLVVPLKQSALKRLIEKTSFAMAVQDVRYYLNGMLFEFSQGSLTLVATDGHRLALAASAIPAQDAAQHKAVIVPRKAVVEMARLFTDPEAEVNLVLSSHHMRVMVENFIFTSKLIDGKYPDYERVIPKGGDKLVTADRATIKESFARVAILSNEKFKGVRFQLDNGALKIQANNPEQEEAEDEISVDYQGATLEIGFNVNYLLDVVSSLTTQAIRITLSDSGNSALLQGVGDDESRYVVMPMRL